MVGDDPLLLIGEDAALLLVARDDDLDALLQVLLGDILPFFPDSPESRLVDDVGELRAGSACCGPRDRLEIDIVRQLHLRSVDFQDIDTALQVRQLDRDPPVKAARAQQRGIQAVRPVGRRQDNNALRPVEAVHLGQ